MEKNKKGWIILSSSRKKQDKKDRVRTSRHYTETTPRKLKDGILNLEGENNNGK